MNILGLNAYHADSSACLLQEGRLVAAVEEERFRRVKHWAGLPTQAAAWCLEKGGIGLDDVDVIAVNRDPKANLGKKVAYTLKKRPELGLVRDRLTNMKRVASLADRLQEELDGSAGGPFRGVVQNIEHHRAHLASSFLVSPFDKAAVLSVDGFGDFASAAWGIGRGTDIQIDGRVLFPHSLGVFYLTITQYLGFPKYGDEYKVMGLAPYGRPELTGEMAEIVKIRPDGTYELDLQFFRHHDEDLSYRWEGGSPTVEAHFTPELERLLGPARGPDDELTQHHMDIGRSAQAHFEECVFAMLEMLHARHPVEAIAMSGGAAMNSVANGKIAANTPFDRVFAPPAPGDSGGAVGAALAAWHDLGDAPRGPRMIHSYYGPDATSDAVAELLDGESGALADRGCWVEHVENDETLCRAVAEAISEGLVIGWYQGGSEFGPRALGDRSILGDPRRADMREILNVKIKLREKFRPFAPSLLREAMSDWFVIDDDVPFMMKVFEIREDRRDQVPAVTHVDGTGRPHTVTAESNPLYYRLISTFGEMTGVPMVVNTSFNENEPIVNTPAEALDCFLRTEMDVLVLGRHIVRKEAPALAGSDAGLTAEAPVG
ncbi:MAG: carbamoyltransferase [Gemmatimonadota bacterium]|nr:carbamoyltransferase [Gemmatimonadota bacterium]